MPFCTKTGELNQAMTKDQDSIRNELPKLNLEASRSASDPESKNLIHQMQQRLKAAIVSNPQQFIDAHSKLGKKK